MTHSVTFACSLGLPAATTRVPWPVNQQLIELSAKVRFCFLHRPDCHRLSEPSRFFRIGSGGAPQPTYAPVGPIHLSRDRRAIHSRVEVESQRAEWWPIVALDVAHGARPKTHEIGSVLIHAQSLVAPGQPARGDRGGRERICAGPAA